MALFPSAPSLSSRFYHGSPCAMNITNLYRELCSSWLSGLQALTVSPSVCVEESEEWARQGARIVKSTINCLQPISNQKRFNELHKCVLIVADLSPIRGEKKSDRLMGRGSNKNYMCKCHRDSLTFRLKSPGSRVTSWKRALSKCIYVFMNIKGSPCTVIVKYLYVNKVI